MQPTQSNLKHYDEDYYASHYGHLLKDRQRELFSEFYLNAVFNRYVPGEKRILDFGAGHGVLSSSVNAECFDASETATKLLADSGRRVYDSIEKVPLDYFDVIFSSHTLEHVADPISLLKKWRTWLVSGGKVLLILPIDTMPGPITNRTDSNLHLFGWNFQQITNCLDYCGYDVLSQEIFNGPFLLNTLGKVFSVSRSAKLAKLFGKLKRAYPQMLTVAKVKQNDNSE